MDVAVGVFSRLKIFRRFDVGVVRWRKIARTADHLRDLSGDGVDDLARISACRFGFRVFERRQFFFPSVGQFALARVGESFAEFGKLLLVFFNERVPIFFVFRACLYGFAEMI